MNRLCTICARGGSRGVPGKNLRMLLGKPLIAHSIEQALRTGLFEVVAVSSDSNEILETARKFGAHFLIKRPDLLATDTSAKIPAIKHCVEETERILKTTFEILVDLDATSPLRLNKDIVEIVQLLERNNVSNIITGTPARRSPYFNLVEHDENGFIRLCKPPSIPVERRQDSPKCFDMNASIYAWKRRVFMKKPAVFYNDTLLFEMPVERSIDIDTEMDFEFVRLLMQKRGPHSENL